MEATISQHKIVCPSYSSSLLTPKIGSSGPTIVSFRVKDQQIFLKDRILRCGQVSKLKCVVKGGTVSEMENELNLEEELSRMRKLNDKCKGSVGVVELLECLEREAIMGDDEGRQPTDYNRRAQIFDKSSKVFQALKESNSADF